MTRCRPGPIAPTLATALAALLLAGCGSGDTGVVVVSAIGAPPAEADFARGAQGTPTRVLIDSTAQGLVRFDAAGQIEPGIAERWIVIDDGMSYIFRLRDAEWSDGRPVTGAEVVAVLRRQLERGSRNPLLPFLSAIGEVVEMTPEVIEVRLRRPRPDLLKLFAQPELAIFRTKPPGGSGPFRIARRSATTALLRPAFDPQRSPDDDTPEPGLNANVRLIGERAALAVARFAAGHSDLVTGGSFVDWPLLATTRVAPGSLRYDPAAGLLGLAIARRDGFLADPLNRIAIAEAIDRNALAASFGAGWVATSQILPEQLDSAAAPATPGWASAASGDRLNDARGRVAAWPSPVTLKIALPAGPGATMLYGVVAASLRAIGIATQRVDLDADAELRLVDAVAPYDSARWYVATACAPCSPEANAAIAAARDAPTLPLRAQHLAEADAALTADAAFIPLARPLRWSLVARRLLQWQGNTRAWHPLNRLRTDTN